MGISSLIYTKNELINFAKKIKCSEDVIKTIETLPEKLLVNNKDKYDLYINIYEKTNDSVSYEYEINYYSDDLIEFLFATKIYTSLRQSVNNIICELIKNNLLLKQ